MNQIPNCWQQENFLRQPADLGVPSSHHASSQLMWTPIDYWSCRSKLIGMYRNYGRRSSQRRSTTVHGWPLRPINELL